MSRLESKDLMCLGSYEAENTVLLLVLLLIWTERREVVESFMSILIRSIDQCSYC